MVSSSAWFHGPLLSCEHGCGSILSSSFMSRGSCSYFWWQMYKFLKDFISVMCGELSKEQVDLRNFSTELVRHSFIDENGYF